MLSSLSSMTQVGAGLGAGASRSDLMMGSTSDGSYLKFSSILHASYGSCHSFSSILPAFDGSHLLFIDLKCFLRCSSRCCVPHLTFRFL
jgi:hypothetical protein